MPDSKNENINVIKWFCVKCNVEFFIETEEGKSHLDHIRIFEKDHKCNLSTNLENMNYKIKYQLRSTDPDIYSAVAYKSIFMGLMKIPCEFGIGQTKEEAKKELINKLKTKEETEEINI